MADRDGADAVKGPGGEAVPPAGEGDDTLLYAGRIIRVGLEWVTQPDGRRSRVETVRHPGGAVALPLDEAGQVCLLRQYRPVIGAWLWEAPAGKIDTPEPPAETARRELAEEAGVEAEHWSSLGALVAAPGYCDERLHLYLARGLRQVPQATEEHEYIEPHWLPLDEAVAMALDGRITDAKTVIILLRAQAALAASDEEE
jgi:ADP-ribose pyrophosphatase